jgi:hypothetical protein
METKPTDRQLIDLIRKRLLEASSGDRKYERPMNWAEADHLMEILARTERNRDMWKGQCERQAAQLTKLHAAPPAAFDTMPDDYETNQPQTAPEAQIPRA